MLNRYLYDSALCFIQPAIETGKIPTVKNLNAPS